MLTLWNLTVLSYVKGVDIILMALEMVSNAHTTFKNRLSKTLGIFANPNGVHKFHRYLDLTAITYMV